MATNGTKPEICQKHQHFEAKNDHFGAILTKESIFTKISKKKKPI